MNIFLGLLGLRFLYFCGHLARINGVGLPFLDYALPLRFRHPFIVVEVPLVFS